MDLYNIGRITTTRIKIMFRNKYLMALCLLLPFVFFMLIGQIFTKSSISENIPIAIIDNDKTEISKAVTEKLKASSSLKCYFISENQISRYIKENKVQGVYIFNKGMEERIKQGNYKGIVSVHYLPQNIAAQGISDILAGELLTYICSIKAGDTGAKVLKDYGVSYKVKDEIIALAIDMQGRKDFQLPLDIKVKVPGEKRREITKFDGKTIPRKFALGMIIMFNTLFLFASCASIMKEREKGLTRRIEAAGVSQLSLRFADRLGIIFSGIIVSAFQFAIMYRTVEIKNLKTFFSIIVIYLVYIYCISSILVLFTRIFKRPAALQSFIPVFVLFTGLLGGCMWSLELMPVKMVYISRFIPTYWVHDALTKVVLFGEPLRNVTLNLIVMAAMGFGVMMIQWKKVYAVDNFY